MEKKMKEILFLEPVFKEMIWGGSRLSEDFGYENINIPSQATTQENVGRLAHILMEIVKFLMEHIKDNL